MDIGFDPVWSPGKTRPEPGITGSHALVDTGAAISCLDNLLAAELSLPVIDEKPVSGADGKFKTNIYLAQVRIPGMGFGLDSGGHRPPLQWESESECEWEWKWKFKLYWALALAALAGGGPPGDGLAQSVQQPFEPGLAILDPGQAI